MARQPEVDGTLVMLGMPMQNEAHGDRLVQALRTSATRTSTQITTAIMDGSADPAGPRFRRFMRPIRWPASVPGSRCNGS